MAETPGTSEQEIKLFYCYAREDEALRDELHVNLAGLRRQYRLTNWHDRKILPGEKWEEAIDRHLSTADVILLLISPYFVDSDYCYGKEMQRALERHHAGDCCVIPILLRPTYWEDPPFSGIQMLPTDAKPITSWPDCYEAFHDVARGVNMTIKSLLASRSRKTKEEWLEKGYAFHKLEWYEEALAAYDQAIRIDPNYTAAYNSKGYTFRDLKRCEEALAAYDQAIHIDPNDAIAYNNRGYALYDLKRYHEALTAYDQAIVLDPNFVNAYNGKGYALTSMGKTEEAEQAFEKARQLGYKG
jgi:tetratricopeptide (TPR) repeat protein